MRVQETRIQHIANGLNAADEGGADKRGAEDISTVYSGDAADDTNIIVNMICRR